MLDDRFWSATVEELKKGYVFDEKNDAYVCLVCGRIYENGIIYKHEDIMLEAKKAAEMHIKKDHCSMFDYLMRMDKKYTGLTELQKELITLFHLGVSDKDIVGKLGGGSTSTIRNHRFMLREKEKQAKVFLAIMGLMGTSENKGEKLVEIHRNATMVDERYAVTEEEREKIIKTYFSKGNETKLSEFPSREKRKIVVLQQIMKSFNYGVKYTEKEVNDVLRSIFEDYVTLRRYLIEYGFMDRTTDCSLYWVKQ